jgi:hypothetical protein
MKTIGSLIATAVLTGALLAQTSPSGTTDDTRRPVQRADRGATDYGWIGLLGLAGLAGLMRRNRSEAYDTSRSDVRRSA